MRTDPKMVQEEVAFQAQRPAGVQVAALNVRPLVKALRKDIDQVFDARRNRTPETGLKPEQLKEIQELYLAEEGAAIAEELTQRVGGEAPTEKLTEQRNINIERHHPGAIQNLGDPLVTLQNMTNADDMAILLDVAGEKIKQDGKRSHDSIRGQVASAEDIKRELEPVFSGKQNGLLNDRQLFAARSMLATMGDDLVGMARQIQGGDQTPQLLLQYKQKSELWLATQSYLQGQVKEVARALSQQNMIAKTIDGKSMQDMMTAMSQAGASPDTIIKQANILLNSVDKADGEVIEGVSKAMRPWYHTAMGAAVEYWKNNILSGPSTHLINVMSNSAVNMYETLLIRPVAAGVGSVRRKVTGADDGVSGAEAMVNVMSAMTGLETGFKAFVRALKSGEGQFGADKGEYESRTYELARRAGFSDTVSEAIQTGTSLSFRALQAEDELFKTVAFMQEISAQATRDGVQKGLKGEALVEHINTVINDPSDEIYEAAMIHAKNLTFTNEDVGGFLGSLADSAKRIAANHPGFGFFVPFINTPTNLVKYAINNSVFSAIAPDVVRSLKKGGAESDIAAARIITSMGTAMAVWNAYESGNITASQPADFKLADLRDQAGQRPESIVIGEGADASYLEMGRLDPMAQSMFMVVNAMEAMKYAQDEKTAMDAFSYLVAEMAKHTFDSTYMTTIGDLVEVMNGRKDPAQIPANIATGLIPYVGTLKAARNYTDTQRRRFVQGLAESGFMHRVSHNAKESLPDPLLNIMGLERTGAYARYWDGTPKKPRMGEFVYAMSPVKVSGVPGHDDPVNLQLVKNRVAPALPDDLIKIPGTRTKISLVDIDRTGKIYDKFVEFVGSKRREYLTPLIKSQSYKRRDEGPRSQKHALLSSRLEKADRDAKAEFIAKQLPGLIREASEQEQNVLARELVKGLNRFGAAAQMGKAPEELKDHYRVTREAGEADPLPPHF